MRIATGRYQARQAIVASGLVPVASTVTLPKFPLGYELGAVVREIAPAGVFGRGLDEAEFRTAYLERLDAFGAEHVRVLLEDIAASHSAQGVVVLCFCDLVAGFCHRRMFAEWWESRTGAPVPEVGEQLRLC